MNTLPDDGVTVTTKHVGAVLMQIFIIIIIIIIYIKDWTL